MTKAWAQACAGTWIVAALALGAGCEESKSTTENAAASAAASAAPVAASASASAKPDTGVVVAIPQPPADVAKVVDPMGEGPYAGPTGTLRGVVRITGDAPPATDFAFPASCGEAAATYGKLFRVGQGGALADTLIAVTGYGGYVPPAEEAAKITIHGCALSRKTVAMTFGQRLEVYSLDKIEAYMPYLDGGDARADLVAIPGGDAVRLYPQQAGRYMLRDKLPKPFLTAEVYVLKYATHDVTDLDGEYEIKGIPVGKVQVSAFLPSIDRTASQDIEIKEGENKLDLALEYKAAAAAKGAPPKP